MQVNTLDAQIGLGSELIDWYPDAISVPSSHLLFDLSPRTDDPLRFCTNTGSIHSMFYIPDRLERPKLLDDEPTKILYSPSVPIILPQMQKPFPSILPKEFISFLCESIVNLLLKVKPAKHEKTSSDKTSKQISIALPRKSHLQAKKRRSGNRKRVTTHKEHNYSRL